MDSIPSNSASTRSKDRLEILIAILLGVAAIIAAWCSFQAGSLSGDVQRSYSEGIRTADAASQVYNSAVSNDIRDESLFLEFAKAAELGDEQTASYILNSLMSPELAAAVQWWADQPDSAGFDSPFVDENPEWSTTLFDEAAELDASAQIFFDDAARFEKEGGSFDQLTVVMAVALFFLGVAGLSRQRRVMVALTCVGVTIILFALVRSLMLGDPGGLL
jgi:hypothetical protein